jgi:NAD(P)-dependent dehydrogenase (short-subunit alcohol dehydrogenase family)
MSAQGENSEVNAVDNGKSVVLVTGASSGFGLLTCLEFAARGYRVVAAMRDLSKQTAVVSAAEARGVRSLIYPVEMDVTRLDQIEWVVRHIAESFGRIDVLVNNAGFALGGFVEDVPLAEWRRQMDTNFFGLIAVTQAVLPIMRARSFGTVINMSSVSGRIAFPGYAPYSASKHAVEGFSESLRLELLPYGIRVVLVEPGSYKTAIWQKGFDQVKGAGQGDSGKSPYTDRLQAVLQYSRLASEQAGDPMDVARLVVRIAEMKRPKLRYPIGRDARIALFGKALMPWRWFERIVERSLK